MKTVHRDHILPTVDSVKLSVPDEQQRELTVTRSQAAKGMKNKLLKDIIASTECENPESSESDEDEVWYYYPDPGPNG